MNNKFCLILLAIFFISCGTNKYNPAAISNSISAQVVYENPLHSIGSLSFKMDGVLYEADASDAKAWGLAQLPVAMLVAKNSTGMMLTMEINNATTTGSYTIDKNSKGSATIRLNGKIYWNRSMKGENYINVRVTALKNQATILLLSGTFEGVLQDKNRNNVQITEGKFTTEKL